MDEAALESRMVRFLSYLAREESLKPWMDEQSVCEFYEADLRLGLHRDIVKVCSVKQEVRMEAAATTVAVDGWCLRHLIVPRGLEVVSAEQH